MENFMVFLALVLFVTFDTVCVTAGDVIAIDPPIILGNDAERIVTVGHNFTLQCVGSKPLTWMLPENLAMDAYEPAQSIIKTSYNNLDAKNPHGVLLELYNVSAIDVGNYTCLFNNTEDFSYENTDETELEELEAKGIARSVYVYVDDPHSLLVPTETIVSGTQYMPLTIPCRPTAPNVQVKLYFGDEEILPNARNKIFDRFIIYERRLGYTIPTAEMSDMSHAYNCTAHRDGISNVSSFWLSLIPYTSQVPKPSLNDSFNGKTAVDGEILLDCFVRINKGVPFQITWDYPNRASKNRIIITNTTTKNISGQNNMPQVIGQSTLKVFNVTHDDAGVYRCKIIDANKNENSDGKKIQVLDKGKSSLKLYEPASLYTTTIKTMKSSKWIVYIDAYPKPEIFWYNNRNKLISTNSLSEKYVINTNEKTSTLLIRNVTLEDRGVYRVMGVTDGITENLNFTLIVESPPIVDLQSKRFYMQSTKASILCTVSGYPLPEVKWYFQECNDTNSKCNSANVEIKSSNYSQIKVNDVTVNTILEMFIDRSGVLTCVGKNKKVTTKGTSIIYAADIENGFGIIQPNEVIAVGDNVSRTCIASIFTHPNEVLHWYKIPENTSIKTDMSSGYAINYSTTKYSKMLTLSVPNITKSQSGKYQCRIEANYSDYEQDQVTLDVKDVEIPVIYQTNMEDNEVLVGVGDPDLSYYCNVKGIPKPQLEWYKDGKPLDVNSDRIKLNDTLLSFSYTREGDEGKYECVAKNRIGISKKFVQLSLNYGKFKQIYIAIIVLLLVVFIVLISVLVYKIKKEKRIRKELSIMGLLHFEEGATESLNPDLGVDDQAELLPYDKKWEFPREKLKLGKQLGSGAFGVVMKATAYGIVVEEEVTTVAVKMVKRTADSTFIKALASELKIMVHLGKHLNVVNLLGACTKNVTKRELFVIVEYCRFGNLHNYLIRHRGNFIDQIDQHTGNIDSTIGSDVINRAYSISSNKSSGLKSVMQPLLSRSSYSREDSIMDSGALDTANTVISMVPMGDDGPITSSGSVQPEWRSNYRGDYNYNKDVKPISTQDLIGWSFQVARGMEYLANRKVLHGDLAARNILLADDNIVKICDFGLAKNMYKSDNYRKKGDGPLPVKWMAVESIRDRVFSTQSDVWSYGIVLWELFSLASTPYPGMEADEKFYNKLVEGYRMEKPNYSNKRLYSIMLECWRARPIQRPSFSELAEKLGDLLEDGVRKHYIDLNDPYMDMNNRWLAERGENDFLAMMSAPDYGNLTSANVTHDYVNDPFGGPTRVNIMSPDDTDAEGYLCMSPAKNGIVNTGPQIFNFPPTGSPRTPNQSNLIDDDQKNEWVPMLQVHNQSRRPGPDSGIGDSKPGSPNVDGSSEQSVVTPSFSNPSYGPIVKSNPDKKYPDDLLIVNDNYIDMSHKDRGFCDNVVIDENISAFSNPSYVTMNSNCQKPFANNIYNNVPPNIVT